MSEIIVARDLPAFRAMRDDWNALYAAADAAPVSLGAVWLEAAWRLRWGGDFPRPFAVMLYESGAPVVAGVFRFGWRGLRPTLYLVDSSLPQSGDLLYRSGTTIAQITELLAAVRRLAPLHRTLMLSACPDDSLLLATARSFPKPIVQRGELPGARIHLSEHSGYDAWLASLSSQFRGNFRRSLRALERLPDFAHVRETGASARAAMNWLLDRKAGWLDDRDEASNWIHSGQARSMLTLLLEMETGSPVRIETLRTGKRIIAAAISFAEGRRRRLFMTAFDPDFARHSPGMVLLLLRIETAFAEGFSEVDLGRGTMQWKDRLTPHRYALVRGRVTLP